MATATTTPIFSFHLSTTQTQPSPTRPKPHLALPHLRLKKTQVSAVCRPPGVKCTSKSIDAPVSEEPDSTIAPAESPPPEEGKFDKRRPEEKFAVLNTGIYECRSCGFKFDEAVGDPSYPIPPGLSFSKLPEDWRCPTCGAAKSFFESKSVEIAGFAENQQYGFGGNALTSGQKALLIYGSLSFFFILFLSGYFLQ